MYLIFFKLANLIKNSTTEQDNARPISSPNISFTFPDLRAMRGWCANLLTPVDEMQNTQSTSSGAARNA